MVSPESKSVNRKCKNDRFVSIILPMRIIYISIGRTQYTTCTALANTYISTIRTLFFGVVSIAQLVEVTDSAVLGGVAEVVSSNPTVDDKNIFQHLPA